MRNSEEGLKSDALRAALKAALTGRGDKLEALLARHGRGADPHPNLRLAAAFGVEVAGSGAAALRIVARFSAHDAAPDTAEVFLPIAAAYAWLEWLREHPDTDAAWEALSELAADERSPVRVGTLNALVAFAVRDVANARAVLAHAQQWLEIEDRDRRYSAAALLMECVGDRRIATALAGDPELVTYLTSTIDEIVGAPRSAERLDGRRRLLMSLPRTLSTLVATLTAEGRGARWLEEQCDRAKHPDLRKALSATMLSLRTNQTGLGEKLSSQLRQTLEGSAKPPRDPTRIRPGTGRGRASRPVR